MRRWEGLVSEYLRELEARGLSSGTIRHRRFELLKFGVWLRQRRPRPNLEEISGELIIKYISQRTSFRTKSTVRGVVSVLKNLGEFFSRKGLWKQNPLRWIRGPKVDSRMQIPRRISKSELKSLWQTAADSRQKESRHVSLALLGMLYGTGLRRGELERLDLDDWRREEGVVEIDGHKTGRERRVPLQDGAARCLEAYLPIRHNILEKTGNLKEQALFVNQEGRRLKGDVIGKRIHRMARKADIPLVSLHQFRHTCASDLIEEGVNLPQVQRILGHAAIESTMRYIAVADPQRKAAVEKHPINAMLMAGGTHDCE